MKVKTRKSKSYTSILLNEITEEAFSEALKTYNSLDGLKVIKSSQKAWEKFIKFHSLTLDKVKAGEEYKILGTTYKVIRNLDYSRNNTNEWYAIVEYFDRNNNKFQEFGIIQTNNFAAGVYETSFKNQTGLLLYF